MPAFGDASLRDRELDLDAVLDIADKRNRDILLAYQRVETAEGNARERFSALLPAVRLQFSQARSQFANVGRGVGEFPRIPPENRFDEKLSATWALINPSAYADWRLSRHEANISALQAEEGRQIVLEAAARGYFNLYRNQRRMEVIEANIERNRVLLDLARSQFEAGVATRVEVTRASALLAMERQNRLIQQALLTESALALKHLLDIDLHQEISLRAPDLEPRPPTEEPVNEAAVAAGRAEYQAAQLEVARNRLSRKAATLERIPSVSLFAEYGYAKELAFDATEESAWIAGVEVSVPLFEGGRIFANERRASSIVREAEIAEEQVREEIAVEVLVARERVRSTVAQIPLSREMVTLRTQELELAREANIAGVGVYNDIVEAQANLKEAEDGLVDTMHQVRLAKLDLATALGDVRGILYDHRYLQ